MAITRIWDADNGVWQYVSVPGVAGSPGPQGSQGVKGDTGAQGPQGATGPQGVAPPGYWFGDPIIHGGPVSASFVKASYPGLTGLWVELLGAGGLGGTAAITAAAQVSIGGGGGGGCYVKFFVLAANIPTSALVIAGGNITVGNPSQFETNLGMNVADEGGDGVTGAAAAALTAYGNPGAGGSTYTLNADALHRLIVTGDDGMPGFSFSATRLWPGAGGGNHWAGMNTTNVTGTSAVGVASAGWGGGGSGGINIASQGTTKAGGNRVAGRVVLTPVYGS